MDIFQQYQGMPALFVALEIVGVVFGIISVVCSKNRNIWVYPTGIVSTAIFVYLLWQFQLFGDMLINAYYTCMSIYGWVLWRRNRQDDVHVAVSRMGGRDLGVCALLAAASAVLVMLVYYFKPAINNGFSTAGVVLGFAGLTPADWTDIFTTSVFLVAMWLMARRKIEHWLFWIIGDVVSVPLYYHKGLAFTALQYVLFTILAVMGHMEWKRSMQER